MGDKKSGPTVDGRSLSAAPKKAAYVAPSILTRAATQRDYLNLGIAAPTLDSKGRSKDRQASK